MTICLPHIRRLRAVACAVFFAAGVSAAAAEVAQEPARPGPNGPPAAGQPPAPAAEAPVDKAKVLAEMYERLRQADDAESAALVAEAIEKLWLRSGSDTVDLLMGRALQMVQQDQFDVALKLLDAIVALEPDYAEGWNQRATVNFLRRDYGSSLGDLRQVLRLDPRHFKAINGLGLILQEIGDKRAALSAFRRALAVHPHLDGLRQAIRELVREVEGQEL